MIRVGLFSQDCTLQPLLSSALGTEFQFFFESKEDGINRLLSEKNCYVMILDLNSNHDSLKERIACARRMMASDVVWVIMAERSRLIFATHRNLGEMVAQGKFRQDLFYRINVMKIEIPSLQERLEDIAPIATHFLHHYGRIFQKPMVDFDPDAMTVLESYHWPGNVRELENVIQRAIILARGNTVRLENLPANLREEAHSSVEECAPGGTFERQLRDYKIRLAATAVRDNHGNKTMAARSLSISRAYLHRLIRLADPGAMCEEEGLEVEVT